MKCTPKETSKECFWIVEWLLQMGRPMKPVELAATLGFKEERVSEAVDVLLKAKLIEADRNGAFFSPHFETDLWSGGFPGKMAEVARTKFEWLDEKVSPKADYYLHPFVLLPIAEGEKERKLEVLSQLIRDAMRKAYLLHPRKPVKGARLYLVQSRVCPLLK